MFEQKVQQDAAVLPVSGGRVHAVRDYFLLILGAQRPLATLAEPQKPFNSLGWMFCVEALTTGLHRDHPENCHMTTHARTTRVTI